MSRQKYFTRTIKSKEVTATVINPYTHELSACTVNVPNDEDVKEYIEKQTNEVLVSVEQETEVESVYKMNLETFLENAVKVENDVKEN